MKTIATIMLVLALCLLAWYDWRVAIAAVLIWASHEITK